MEYVFNTAIAQQRWNRYLPLFVVDTSLGYPILLVDDFRNPVLAPENLQTKVDSRHVVSETEEEELRSMLQEKSEWAQKVEEKPGLHGTGVFAKQDFQEGSIVASYSGEVVALEQYSQFPEEQQHWLVVLNDGANGIAIDGNCAGIDNKLKLLNHSCNPNIKLRELFFQEHWIVVASAIKNIKAGDEIVTDYDMHTEDEELKEVLCKCKSENCRKYLFYYHSW